MSSLKIREYINCVLLETADDLFLKIKRLLYTYTIGLLNIPARYKPMLTTALESDQFYITGYDTVYQEARSLWQHEKACYEYDDVFILEDLGIYLQYAIADAVDEIATLIISHMHDQFEVDINSVPVPTNDTLVLLEAIYKTYKKYS